MSAPHSAVQAIYPNEAKVSDNPLIYNPARLSDYFDEAFTHVPILKAITAFAPTAAQ